MRLGMFSNNVITTDKPLFTLVDTYSHEHSEHLQFAHFGKYD